jgi:hypothetical protein
MKSQFDEQLPLANRGNSVAASGPLEKGEDEVIKYFVARVNQGDDCVAEGIYIGDIEPIRTGAESKWELELEVRGSMTMTPGNAFGTAVIVFEEDEGLFTYTWTYPVELVEPSRAR